MRIAVIILGLILGPSLALITFVGGVFSETDNPEAAGGATAWGVLILLLWLVAVALVMALPLISMVIFIGSAVLGFVASDAAPAMSLWGAASLVLAVISFFGWIGKRKADRRERRRDEWMAQTAAQSGQRPPS